MYIITKNEQKDRRVCNECSFESDAYVVFSVDGHNENSIYVCPDCLQRAFDEINNTLDSKPL